MHLKAVLTLFALPAVLGLQLPNGVGKLPALGWNSWNAYFCNVDQNKVMQAANAMVNLGFKNAGYQYIILDDCWAQKQRDPNTNRILPDFGKFPDGMNGVANKVHALGLKYGMYSSAGTMTCGQYPGSLGYEMIDAKTFADWGVDYLKYDNCFPAPEWIDDCFACNGDPSFDRVGKVNGSCTASTPVTGYYSWNNTSPFCAYKFPVDGVKYSTKYTALKFKVMERAIRVTGRPILYSLCNWGVDQVWTWGNATGHSWRMANDIGFGTPSFPRILEILNVNSFLLDYTDFWGRNDPDMLEIGNGLTAAQERTHFAMWAIMKGPLLIGTDMTKLTQAQIALLQNKYLLAFNQDPVVGKPAKPYKWGLNPNWTFDSTKPAMYWSGASSRGTLVALLNPTGNTMGMSAVFSEIPQLRPGAKYSVTNVWTGQSIGCIQNQVDVQVIAHDTAVYLFEREC
ncbi:putative alpha-galactosidase B [Coprinopsis sp. MPI-PUGE-AT-0042]|nr:putative alpha-galactosidase B [Coprinopsis sp. MPI-PUGE-AT-0042]